MRTHVFLQLGGVTETFPALHTDVREAFTVNGQQVSVEQSLLGSFILTELALVRLGGWRRRRRRRRLLTLGLPLVVLQPVGKQRRLLVELLAAHFALQGGLAAQGVHLHVVVEAGFLVGGELTVCALVLFSGQNLLVMILCVPLQESARFELFATKHAGIHGQRLTIGTDDDGWQGEIRATSSTFLTKLREAFS